MAAIAVNRLLDTPEAAMSRALELAARGIGRVEPNPPVGALVVDEKGHVLGEGYHERFGGPHAEVHALRQAGPQARGATLYVTLEPCCHHGKTPPCTQAIIDAGIRRVVAAVEDPSPHASGAGLRLLRDAGIEVNTGLLAEQASRLLAPFFMRVTQGRPWVHAKWAMTLDGKIATVDGDSRWISNELSRAQVHQLRGRMDAILVGAATARRDDPLLTARPPGPRTPCRIVLDSRAGLPLDSQLVRTVHQAPVMLVTTRFAQPEKRQALEQAGVEVLELPVPPISHTGDEPVPATADEETPQAVSHAGHATHPDPAALLRELGRREMTNVLVEGGGTLLGSFFDLRLIDEVHVFIAPKLVGGAMAPAPIGGAGCPLLSQAPALTDTEVQQLGTDVYIHGFVSRDDR